MPIEDLNEEDDSPFPSLKEAEEMAMEASKKMCVKRNLNELPVHVSTIYHLERIYQIIGSIKMVDLTCFSHFVIQFVNFAPS